MASHHHLRLRFWQCVFGFLDDFGNEAGRERAVFHRVFNTFGQVLSQTEAGVNTTSLIYSNNTTIITDPLGHVRLDVHTPTGELASFTDESNQTITLGSNPFGQRASASLIVWARPL